MILSENVKYQGEARRQLVEFNRTRSILIGGDDGSDGTHCLVDPTCCLSIAGFKLTGTSPCLVKFGRQPRPIDIESVDLLCERTTLAVVLQPRFQGGIQCIERVDHASDSLPHAAHTVGYVVWAGHVLTAFICSPFRSQL